MKRFRYPMAVWPWYLRWTGGTVLFFGLLMPVAMVGALLDGVRGAWRAYRDSGVWTPLAACMVALIFGDLED